VDSGVPETSSRVGTRPNTASATKKATSTAAAARTAKNDKTTKSGTTAKTGTSAKTAGKVGTTQSNGVKVTESKNGVPKNGAPKNGPVDPRTEDPSSPFGIARLDRTTWRRPGTLSPSVLRDLGRLDDLDQVDESAAEALVVTDAPTIDEPTVSEPVTDHPMPAEPIADPIVDDEAVPAPSTTSITEVALTEVVPSVTAPTITTEALVEAPTALVPTEPAPTERAPIELVPTELPDTDAAPILYDEAATIDDVTQIGPVLEPRPLRRPIRIRRSPKPRVRRVTRVVRHVDTWSVFKVALVFNVFFYAVALVAGVLLWQVAYATGTVDNVQKFFEGFGWETFKFKGGQIFHNAWIAGLFVAVGMTGLAVLLATMFNLITDLVGGIRLTVLEEEVRTRVERGTEARVDPPPTADAPVAEPALDQSTEPWAALVARAETTQ
jgi:Transmembrane domain of unknown function (DUF3566)